MNNNTTPEARTAAHATADGFANNLGFDDEQRSLLHSFLDAEMAAMENEDPNRLIPCCCHGDLHPSRDVDAWGNCWYTQQYMKNKE